MASGPPIQVDGCSMQSDPKRAEVCACLLLSCQQSRMKSGKSSALTRVRIRDPRDPAILDQHRAITDMRNMFTKSCREIVAKARKSPNPRPGPIPALMPMAGVLRR